MLVITIISIYCAFSYMFIAGVGSHLPEGKKYKWWVRIGSPFYFPYMVGEQFILNHQLAARKLKRLDKKEHQEKMEAAKKAAFAQTLGDAFKPMAKEMESMFGIGQEQAKPKDTRSEWQKRMDEMRHRPTPTHESEKAIRDFFNGKW